LLGRDTRHKQVICVGSQNNFLQIRNDREINRFVVRANAGDPLPLAPIGMEGDGCKLRVPDAT
jgi:hypothetical protein